MIMADRDPRFFDRADAFIRTANDQIEDGAEAGQVSASFMYGLARYSAWFSASGWKSGADMASAKAETLEFFVNEYRKMLALNLDDYINNFDNYIDASQEMKNHS